MDYRTPKLAVGTSPKQFDECLVHALPSSPSVEMRFPVVLKISAPDRTRDNPILVYLPEDHAIRLIKELAASILNNYGP